jgi:hypothetical protein
MTTEEMLQATDRFVDSDLPQPEKLYLLDNLFRSLCQQRRMVAEKRSLGKGSLEKDSELSQAATRPTLERAYK